MAFMARMKKELQLLEDPPHGIAAWLRNDSDLTILDAQIEGIEEPYKNGTFRLEINLSQKYPFEPPNVRCARWLFYEKVQLPHLLPLPLTNVWPTIFADLHPSPSLACSWLQHQNGAKAPK